MFKRRVAITGMGAVSPFGLGVEVMIRGIASGACALSRLDLGTHIGGIQTDLLGKVPDFDAKVVPREYRRSMSPLGIYSFLAAREALQNAGIPAEPPLSGGYEEMGTSIASTISSANAYEDFFRHFIGSKSVEEVRGTVFFKVMSHAAASNLSVSFGLKGRCISPSAACASGLQAVGLAYEAIAFGRADLMLCGGAEEYHPLFSATFDRLGAASHGPDPHKASRPFDLGRDGIVCSEGAGILLLEEYERALSRKTRIIAEVVGIGINASPASIVSPDAGSISRCMALALADAGIGAAEVACVNAHATSTEHGDIAEGQAIAGLFGENVPVNSLKGHLGHTMGASGALELIASIAGWNEGVFYGTLNLENPDLRCGRLALSPLSVRCRGDYLLKNSFGLGGVNASAVMKRSD